MDFHCRTGFSGEGAFPAKAGPTGEGLSKLYVHLPVDNL